MKKSYDALVLGGGVIGCATAFNLARLGAKVAVIEKGPQAGAGATSRSSACLRIHYSVPQNARLANHALHYFRNFRDRLQYSDADAGYTQSGHMLIGGDDELGETMRATVDSLAGLGFDTEMIDLSEARHLHPQLSLDGVKHIGWEPLSGYADPYLTTMSFKSAAQQLGATFLTGTEVTGLLMRDAEVLGVQSSEGGTTSDIYAGTTVSCLNIWTPSLSKWLGGYELPMRLEKHHLIAVRRQGGYMRDEADDEHTTALLPNVKCLMQESQPYFRAYDGGRSLLVGNNHPEHIEEVRSDCADDSDWDETVTMDQQAHCAGLAQQRFMGYDEAEIVHSWSGLYDVSDDWNPVLGPLDGVGGLVAGFGFSGHGFKLSPIVGEMLAAHALGEAMRPEHRDCDIADYGIRRFAGGSELRGVYHGAAS
jgi:glycine/D-amino acid oxidase-like deaminating enzyme